MMNKWENDRKGWESSWVGFKANIEYIVKVLILVCFLILLKVPLETLFSEYAVKPGLSLIWFYSWWQELLVVVIIFVLINWNALWKWNFYVPSLSKSFLIFLIAAVYSFYRFFETGRWDLYDSKLIESVKTIDIIVTSLLIFQVLIIVRYGLRTHKKVDNKNMGKNEIGFIEDQPIPPSGEGEELGYGIYADQIVERINQKSDYKTAFAIGINGKWGSGKSSLMNLIKKSLKPKESILIDFDPWKSKSAEYIVPDFFTSLQDELGKYHFGINSLIRTYSDRISSGNYDNFFHYIFRLFTFLYYPSNTILLFNQINKKIKGIGKKIFIFIDDVDRLDKDEIIECLKLIRNSANFSNVIFIVAYDREYLIDAIEKLNRHNKQFFLEKIFQLEVSLPYYDRKKLEELFEEKLKPHLSPSKIKELEEIIRPTEKFYSKDPFFEKWVHSVRDVNRLVNSLILNFHQIWDDINLKEAIKVELIRVKYPTVYYLLLTKKNEFFGGPFLEFTYSYSMSTDTPVKQPNNEQSGMISTKLNTSLKENYSQFNEDEINKVCSLVESLFYRESDIKSSGKPKDPLSIRHKSRFYLYFQYRPGRDLLRERDLLDAIKYTKAFKVFIDKCIENKKEASLISRLEYFYEFDNREMYESIVEGILYLGNKTVNKSYFTNFNHDFLVVLLSIENGHDKLYPESEKTEHKNFILEMFMAKNNPDGVVFNSNFLNRVLFNTDDQQFKTDLFGSDQNIQKCLIEYLQFWIQKTPSLDRQHIILYYNCEEKSADLQVSSRGRDRTPLKEASELMKDFIIKGNVIPFLYYVIRPARRDQRFFTCDKICEDIFGTVEEMITSMKENSDSIEDKAAFEEFLEFSELVLNAPYKMAKYKFKNLNVQS